MGELTDGVSLSVGSSSLHNVHEDDNKQESANASFKHARTNA